MKNIFLFIACLFAGNAFGTPTIHEALKNPSAVTVLQLNGTANEANLLTKNASKFTSLHKIIISEISDSITAEQDLIAVASCSGVSELSIDNCGFSHLSGALKMLVSVNTIEISNCKKLDANAAFTSLAAMPSLKTFAYSTDKLISIPQSFIRIRGLEKISIHNTDLSLADGYALNNSDRASLEVSEKLELGFGTSSLLLEYSCYDKNSAKEHISIMRDLLQGVACMNGEMTLPQKPKAFTRENPLVKPPVEGLDVRKNIYSANASSGGLVEYPSGTKIIIPEHAFVDANGNEVKGEVTIDYREFRDPIDILVSGIPMVYDSAGQKGNFESAGMFEINASVNGQEVFLAPGKKVNVNFAVVDTASSYNFYRLDAKNGWEYLGKPGAVINTESAGEIDDIQAIDSYNRMLSYRRVNKRDDTTAFADRYEDTDYVYTVKKAAYFFTQKVNPKKYSSIAFKKTLNGKDFTVFQIQYSHRKFPEMNAFASTNWMIDKKMSAGSIRKKFGPKRGLHDMRIEYNGDNDFTLQLKDLHGFEEVSVTPVRIINGKPVAYKTKECNWRYRSYSHQLKTRERTMTRQLKRESKIYFRMNSKNKVDTLEAWNAVHSLMTPAERKLTFVEWKKFAKEKIEGIKTATNAEISSSAGILRSLTLDGFGIYNCDQIQRLDNPVEVFATTKDASGQEQDISTIYIIDNHTNGVLTYGAGWENLKKSNNGIDIAFSPQYQTSMIALGSKGELYVGGPDEFKGKTFVTGSHYVFTVIPVGENQTIGQLRELLFPKTN